MTCTHCANPEAELRRLRLDHALEIIDLYRSKAKEIDELKATIASQARHIHALLQIIEREAVVHHPHDGVDHYA